MHKSEDLPSKGPTNPSIILIFLSLLFLPGVYLILFFAAFLPIVLWWNIKHYTGDSSQSEGGERILLWGAFISAYACLRGIWVTLIRKKRYERALIIDRKRHNEFDSFLNHICATLKTTLPDFVILHSDPIFFVQKGRVKVINGEVTGKVLAIGMPLLNGITTKEFRSILFHEFSHFTGNDTLYSSYVAPIYVGLRESIDGLLAEIKSEGDNLKENIIGAIMKIPMLLPYFILKIYFGLFILIDMKLSRQREKRADEIAALMCGSATFTNALKLVIKLSRTFIYTSEEDIIQLLAENKAYNNYYKVFYSKISQLSEIADKFEMTALNEHGSFFNTHPTLKIRLGYLPNVQDKYNDSQLAIFLFGNLEIDEQILTKHYTDYLAKIKRDKIIQQKHKSSTMAKLNNVCPSCHERVYEGAYCHYCGNPL